MTREDDLEDIISQIDAKIQQLNISMWFVAESIPPSLEIDAISDTNCSSVAFGIYYEMKELTKFISESLCKLN